MLPCHLRDVLRIERESFLDPWTEKDFYNWNRPGNCLDLVAESDGRAIAFALYELYDSHIKIVSFAVASEYRRCGVGWQLLGKLVEKFGKKKRTAVTVCVRETNLPAQLLFQSQGFVATHIERGYYGDTGEDGYAMECALIREVVPILIRSKRAA